jgi:hypothetical protein
MTGASRVVPNVLLDVLTLLSMGNVSNKPYCQTYDYLYLCGIFFAFKRRCLIAKVMFFILLKSKNTIFIKNIISEIRPVFYENIMHNS